MLESLLTEYNDVRLRPSGEGRDAPAVPNQPPVGDRATISPDDRLEQALAELREGVATELLELLSQVSPAHFETIVLDLLRKLGHGTSRADLLRVGRSGDGGIDAVISLDRLGLEKVYVQAKLVAEFGRSTRSASLLWGAGWPACK